MNCVRWSMGDASLHGMSTSWVPGQCFGCYPCPWTKLLPMCPDRTVGASDKQFERTAFEVACPVRAAVPPPPNGSVGRHRLRERPVMVTKPVGQVRPIDPASGKITHE